MKKKRERFDIIHDILITVQSRGEIGPTRLLQLSNLSPKMFRDYIKELTETKLLILKENNGKKKYQLTDKGDIFLQRYKVFSNFINQLGL